MLAVTPTLLPFSYLLNIRGFEVEHRRSFDAIVVVYVFKGAGWLLASPNDCFTEGVTHLCALLHSRHTHYRRCGKKVQRFGENKINLATLLRPALILYQSATATQAHTLLSRRSTVSLQHAALAQSVISTTLLRSCTYAAGQRLRCFALHRLRSSRTGEVVFSQYHTG